ncbi:Crp/Fnr family transcriptional regulator [Escherichia coli]|nr:Crp/Fnr family transcriptional regulator [Salmonella enterica]EFC6552355.1 Crp/Fnr family transcriptional regulator [Escherichia coli]MCM7070641.1 Crp/Fnr family transcriptional regulator [Enterobacter hormaechei]EBB7791867.1 Crp/Fnr family transcriptional regulator [Salmonella enterica subsp. enterica serovar Senftenberg]EBF7042234.1 Crp/Fnr family transcriptional regulator [Salmonella enterica subsp. enterica serovar Senftenberg]EFL7416961.1 Crp/Fnr family transcriptional regulator [Esche
MRAKMRVSALNLMDVLNQPSHHYILQQFHKKKYRKGDRVSSPHMHSNEVLIVSSGQLRVFLSYAEREFTLYYLESGDIFSTHTRAYINAVKESVILTLPTRIFHQLLITCPEMGLQMTGILGDMLGSSWDIIESITFHDARTRLIDFIVSQGKERGVVTETGTEFECDLTMEEISLIIGSTRQTTSSLFNVLIKDGDILRTGKNKYVIGDITALSARLAEYKS